MNTNKCKRVANFQIIFIRFPEEEITAKSSGYFHVHPSKYLTNIFERNRICSPNENNVLLPPKSPSSLSHILFWFCQPKGVLLVILKIIIIIITAIINNFDSLTVENKRVAPLKTFQIFQDLLRTSTNWSIPDDSSFVWQFYQQQMYSFNSCVGKKYRRWHSFRVTNHCRRWLSHHWVLVHIHSQGPKYFSLQYVYLRIMWYIMWKPIVSTSTYWHTA